MKKSIKNHNIKSLADLYQRQDTIQYRYVDLGKEIFNSIFSPTQIAGLAFSLISARNKKRKANKETLFFTNNKKSQTPTIEKSKGKRFMKSIANSWIKWQVFNLAFFLGKKAIAFINEKRKHSFN